MVLKDILASMVKKVRSVRLKSMVGECYSAGGFSAAAALGAIMRILFDDQIMKSRTLIVI